MNRRWRVPRVARPRRFEPPFVTAAPVPPVLVPDILDRPKLRKPALRRGRSFSPVPPQVQVAAPALVLSPLRATPRPKVSARRSKFTATPIAPDWTPGLLRAVPRRIVLPRRGRSVTVYIAAPATVPAVPPVVLRQVRRNQLVPRRGHFTSLVWPQITVTAPSLVLASPRRSRRVGVTRRGRFLTVPSPAVTPTVLVDITVDIGPTRIDRGA